MLQNPAFQLPQLGSMIIDDLQCVSGTWFYFGIGFSSEVQYDCYDPISIVDMQSPAPSFYCGETCREIIPISAEPNVNYMHVYDMDEVYSNYTIRPVTISYNCCPGGDFCGKPSISCEQGTDFKVFFSRNYKPMKVPRVPYQSIIFFQYSPNDDSIPISCSTSSIRLSPDSPDPSYYWTIDGITLVEPAVACFSSSPQPQKINMNGCKCPQIELADKAEVLANPLSAYLANRTIFYPYAVNVTESCEVTIDAPASCEYDNYYFMIFRSNGPPIFVSSRRKTAKPL